MAYTPLEYPKWRDGKFLVDAASEKAEFGKVIVSSTPGLPDAPPAGFVFNEYPKWVGGRLVNSADEELAAMETLTGAAA